MFETVLKLAGLVIFFYMLLPTILGRLMHLGSIFRGSKKSGLVALTFDDGPDPDYTPQVLDVLQQYQAKATFFLVGQHAVQNQGLVKRIIAEGHSIGTHGYLHRFAWLQSPWSATREISSGIKAIEGITGNAPRFFRPAWGVFNLFTYIYLLLSRQQTVLWTFMSWDWHPGSSPRRIHDIVQSKVKSGDIIVFHDRCTKPGAVISGPANMVAALPCIMQTLQQKNLRAVSLDELLLCQDPYIVKKILRSLWQVWEYCFERLAGLRPVGGQENSLFRLAVRHYRGRRMELPDGTTLLPGDKIGELHFNNKFLQKITTTARSLELIGLALLRETRRSLPVLAKTVSQDPAYQGIKALMGITMIHRGTSQLGFSVYDLTPGLRSLVAWYQRWLMFLLHPGGLSHLRRQWHKLTPKKVVISKHELLKRYLSDNIAWPERGKTNPAKGTANAR
ncbi:polysaccharide deacetylase family protein [Desulforamulus hydrothermalis]|uniref:Polysaccharide deacetylase n=1 Tax=Desulforamulus hydrothermalis Lam5 = DSM 18033 TaxID=1121428 RepID=K8EAM9_9FIRM|nr:polysaccharide deacetylase family protein [Desulforamulus hydrothermalis]CCO08698.1 Polysaccharide deacetylase [Desulforamulus hydrothermalis Lam5 = DSM 18033]SHG69473.1 Peptidoglycan/xylan/chitin deacetylase, PgdA/CDA1 family [Desulforamulus hydrothermalis Lam5 = DSM 18033]